MVCVCSKGGLVVFFWGVVILTIFRICCLRCKDILFTFVFWIDM